jgi:hypothetical protein
MIKLNQIKTTIDRFGYLVSERNVIINALYGKGKEIKNEIKN